MKNDEYLPIELFQVLTFDSWSSPIAAWSDLFRDLSRHVFAECSPIVIGNHCTFAPSDASHCRPRPIAS